MSSIAETLNSSVTSVLYYDQFSRIGQRDTTKWKNSGVNGTIKGSNGDAPAQFGSGSAAALRLPLRQELDDVLRTDAHGGFEFPLFLADDQLPVRIENGQAGDTLFQGNFIFLCEVQVLVILADVHMHHVKVVVNQGRDLPGAESGVQNVAVVTPIAAKNQNDALVIFRGSAQRGGNFRGGFLGIRIKLRIRFGGLGKAARGFLHHGAPLRRHDAPLTQLLHPYLRPGNHGGFFSAGSLELQFIAQNKSLDAGLQVFLLEYFDVKMTETSGPQQ